MDSHFKTFSAIFPLIIKRDGERSSLLLHRRRNTGYMDGMLDISGSGHVDEGETAREAVVRECKEELGIDVRAEDLVFAHLSHRISPDRTYYDIYFIVNRHSGTPAIMEPDKCTELDWFDLDELPADMIDCRKRVVRDYLNGLSYSEIVE